MKENVKKKKNRKRKSQQIGAILMRKRKQRSGIKKSCLLHCLDLRKALTFVTSYLCQCSSILFGFYLAYPYYFLTLTVALLQY